MRQAIEPVVERIIARHLLVVEGPEDRRFFGALLAARHRTGTQVVMSDGKDDIGRFLRDLARAPGFGRVRWLGVIQDADDSASAAFQRVCSALRRAGLAVPRAPWEIAGDHVETLVCILPDGLAAGDLESMVLAALAGTPALTCIEGYFDCLVAVGDPLPRQLSKAYLHAYLVSLEPPRLRLGEAAERGLLPLDNPVFDRLIGLLP